jgi:tetratricopeptide (TPR) repeat protein
MVASIDLYDRALARDPAFALAHAAQAIVHAELAEMGVFEPDMAYSRAAEELTQALHLDPQLDVAHCALAFLKAVREYDWDGAERGFIRALELNPSSSDTCDLYGRFCAGVERYDEALALLARAADLDPLVHRIDIMTTLLRAGRIDDAIAHGEAAADIHPTARVRATLGWAYFLAGRRDEGLAELTLAAAEAPDTLMWLAQLGEAHGLRGNKAKAREILHDLEGRAKHSYVSPYYFAYVHTGLGEADRAIDYLERAVDQRAGPAYSIKGSFLFASLRAHPRFRALLAMMRLA